jgi:hypothetical protein
VLRQALLKTDHFFAALLNFRCTLFSNFGLVVFVPLCMFPNFSKVHWGHFGMLQLERVFSTFEVREDFLMLVGVLDCLEAGA